MLRSFFAAVLLGSAVYAADLPLVASHLVTGPASHVLLTNTGRQPVNAWSLAVTTPAGEGRTHQVVETVDAYLSDATRGLPGMSEKLDRLLPGQVRELPLDPVPAGADVRVVAVVFEDDTALGDAEAIRSIFQRRAAERDELHRVIATFDDVLASRHGIPALEELKNRLGASSTSAANEPTPHRAAREAVDSYLGRATPENADQVERLLRGYVALVERQHQLAVQHARQKS